MKKEEQAELIMILSFFAIVTIIGVYIFFFANFGVIGLNCKSHTWFNKELYCKHENTIPNEWKLHNKTMEEIDEKEYQKYLKEQYENKRKQEQQRKECYNKGQDYNYSFDIIKDYNLTCKQISYINDHLIDKTRKEDSGYINGYYNGFLSYGTIEAHVYQYVTEGVLATGQLIQNISYHLDCNNKTENNNLICNNWGYNCNYEDTIKIKYYTESDFIMYYVQNCI